MRPANQVRTEYRFSRSKLLCAQPGTLPYRNIHCVRRLTRRSQNNVDRSAARQTPRDEHVYLIESRECALRPRERYLRILSAGRHGGIRGSDKVRKSIMMHHFLYFRTARENPLLSQ